MPAEQPRNKHVAALVARYCGNRSIRQIEADNGLKQGRLQHYLSPNYTATTTVRLDAIELVKQVTGATIEEVSRAFALDSDIPITGLELEPDELELLDNYRALSPSLQQAVLRMITTCRAECGAVTTDVALNRPQR